uniref:polynucleotide adenylyltransferase n=1 Tax=Romanomermis culicivorax TaxID=13658 RepID=A0A915JDH5_ROMCU
MTSVGHYQQQRQKNKNYNSYCGSTNEKQRNNSCSSYKRAPRFQNRSNICQEKSNQAILNTDQAPFSPCEYFFQMTRLYAVMQEPLEVHGRGNFPTLYVCLRRFIRCVIRRLDERGLKVKRVKLNGGAASYVLATKTLPSYNDIDLIFDVDLLAPTSSGVAPSPSNLAAKFDLIKHSVFDALIEFLPQGVNRSKMCAGSMKTAYVRKMVKVCDGFGDTGPCLVDPKTKPTTDLWSLISLNNNQGRFLELKFVERMRRQFEFSVDSFQIDLDPIIKRDRLRSYDDDSVLSEPFTNEDGEKMIIKAESMYGDFQLALKHLDQMLIDTVSFFRI